MIRRIAISAVFLLTLAGVAASQPVASQQALPAGPSAAASRAGNGAEAYVPDVSAIELSVGDAVVMALKNNYQINIRRFDPLVAERLITEAWGAFDTIFNFKGSWDDNKITPTGNFTGGREYDRTIAYAVALAKKLVTGTVLNWGYDFNRFSTSNTLSTRFPSYYNTDMFLTIKQPLVRGAGVDYNKSQINISKNTLETARQQLMFDAINQVGQVEAAYWNLVFAREDLRVNQESLVLAEQVLAENLIKFRAGVIPEIEVEGAKANVEQSRGKISVAISIIKLRSDELRDLLSLPEHNALKELELVPRDKATEVRVPPLEVGQQIAVAFQNRPDIKGKRSELSSSEIRIQVAANEVYPTVDLEATFRLNGLDPSFHASQNQLFDGDTREGAASITVNVPLENRTAVSRHEAAILARRQAVLDLYKLEQRVITDVREAVRAVDTSVTNIRASEQGVIFNQKNLASEQIRKEAGDQTSLDVLKAREQLATAERTLIRAIIQLRLALINLEIVKGTLVTEDRVYIAPVEKTAPGIPGWTWGGPPKDNLPKKASTPRAVSSRP